MVLPHAGWLTSRILHARRRGTLGRLARLASEEGGFGPPLAERAAALTIQVAGDDAMTPPAASSARCGSASR